MVTLGLHALVPLGRIVAAREIRDHGVVNDERAGYVGAHAGGVSPALDNSVAHGREVNEHGNAREVLEERAGRHELDLGTLRPREASLDHTPREFSRLLVAGRPAHAVLEQNDEGAWQACGTGDLRDVIDETSEGTSAQGSGDTRARDGALEVSRCCHGCVPPSC